MTTKRVYILGAGASAPSGVPVVKGFFNAIEDSKHSGAKHFQTFMRGYQALRGVHAKGRLDTQNIEEVLGAFELAQLCEEQLVNDVDPKELVDAAKRVIGDVIAERSKIRVEYRTTSNTVGPSASKIEPPLGYRSLTKTKNASFITFNQDLMLEYALWLDKVRFHHAGLQDADSVPIIKLHGSLNWERDEKSKAVMVHDPNKVFASQRREWFDEPLPGNDTLIHEKTLPTIAHTPLIVPPSWAKYAHYLPISAVWKAAVAALRAAQEIYVIGYSLPESDFFFRHLFAIGTLSDTRIRKFLLIDPNAGQTQARYRRLLGAELEHVFESRASSFGGMKEADFE
ncbi:MAG: hypothetical protein AAF436_05060 [Myxococcota bacterium]